MRTTWDKIIKSDKDSIDLIGYGSILNQDSHEGDTSHPETVIVHGFQRLYNLKMVPDSISDETMEEFRKKYWEKYGIESIEDVKELRNQKVCVLNCLYTGNKKDMVNGVHIRISRSDFETYKKREEIYDLYSTHYNYIDPESGKITQANHSGYILSALEKYIIEDGHAFIPYHNFAREGAYKYGEYFGKLFDSTTKGVQGYK